MDKIREVIDVLSTIIFHYFHSYLKCLSLLQSDSIHTQITYVFPETPIFIKTESFSKRISDRKISINISRFLEYGSSENKMFNSKLSAALHILKYLLNLFIDSVVGKSKQLFQLKMLTC